MIHIDRIDRMMDRVIHLMYHDKMEPAKDYSSMLESGYIQVGIMREDVNAIGCCGDPSTGDGRFKEGHGYIAWRGLKAAGCANWVDFQESVDNVLCKAVLPAYSSTTFSGPINGGQDDFEIQMNIFESEKNKKFLLVTMEEKDVQSCTCGCNNIQGCVVEKEQITGDGDSPYLVRVIV
jgi:hypothetical protein